MALALLLRGAESSSAGSAVTTWMTNTPHVTTQGRFTSALARTSHDGHHDLGEGGLMMMMMGELLTVDRADHVT